MSFHYLPELVGDCSAPISSDGEPSVPWKSNRTVGKLSCGVSGTVCSPCSRYGTTAAPSTEDLGVESWMSSLRASRVSHSALPESDGQSKTSATDGPIPSESYARWDRDSRSWRMFQGLLLTPTSEQSLAILPRRGSMRSGTLYRRDGLEHRRSVSVFGLSHPIPAPTKCDHKGSGRLRVERGENNNLRDWCKIRYGLLYPPVALGEWLQGIPKGWTDLQPLEMDKFRLWSEKHGRD